MTEFDLIARYFTRKPKSAALGVGDDCALLSPSAGTQLAVSSDMLVEGRHFFADVSPYSLGHKALAVNLSDLAACGAKPIAFTLALALPSINEAWLQEFSRGLWALADAHGCELIGGDTTQGSLNICITVFGEVPRGQALLRSGAQVGDDCALINLSPGMQLAISSDMLVEGRHFFADVSPYSLSHKALAVNLSDLAACGATPVAFTLALALPSINEAWLQEFSNGMWALADAHGCELIGGDTTQGLLNIC